MKLYNSIGPNPKTVRMFMAEKGIELPTVEVDIMAGENCQGAYMAKNASAQCPALELDNRSAFGSSRFTFGRTQDGGRLAPTLPSPTLTREGGI
jgi:glutathione S-transferase